MAKFVRPLTLPREAASHFALSNREHCSALRSLTSQTCAASPLPAATVGAHGPARLHPPEETAKAKERAGPAARGSSAAAPRPARGTADHRALLASAAARRRSWRLPSSASE
jgi:hypothetical protein